MGISRNATAHRLPDPIDDKAVRMTVHGTPTADPQAVPSTWRHPGPIYLAKNPPKGPIQLAGDNPGMPTGHWTAQSAAHSVTQPKLLSAIDALVVCRSSGSFSSR